MLTIGILLLLTMMAAEIMLIKEVPWIGRLIRRSRLASLGFSLGLSFVLGLLFPAAGMLMFFAAIASTVLMQPIYWGMDKWAKYKGYVLQYVAMVREIIDTVHSAVIKVRNVLSIPRRMIRWIIRPHFNFGGTNPRR